MEETRLRTYLSFIRGIIHVKRQQLIMIKPLQILIIVTLSLIGCSSRAKPFDPNKERKFFSVAVRQYAPEPVYNRLMTAYLPEPLPSRNILPAAQTRISPIYQFELKNTSLEQTARVLASTARYTSYTSSVIASRKINILAVGTIDEIAEHIENRAGINVVVDHANREVRFLANGTPMPRNRKLAEAPASKAEIEGLGEVKISEKTDGFLNRIRIEG